MYPIKIYMFESMQNELMALLYKHFFSIHVHTRSLAISINLHVIIYETIIRVI